ncbi:MAG: hypothetical protein ABI843_17000 [Dokdonella sp.]
MRHIIIAGLGALLATQAFAQGSTASKSRSGRKANTETAALYDANRNVTAPDANAPGNNWGKKEAPASKPRTCSYDGAMSDEDIARCRR